MKKLLLFFTALALVSCTNEKTVEAPSEIFIVQKLNDFVAANPNWTKDEITTKETTDKFKRQAIKWSNEQEFLKGMPMQLQRITDTTEAGQSVKVAHFLTFSDKARPANSKLNYITLHIKGIVSDEQKQRLQLDKKYYLTGNLQRQGKRADVKFVNVSEFKGYNIGSYTFLITGFKPI